MQAGSWTWPSDNTINFRNREKTNSQIYGFMPLLTDLIHKLLKLPIYNNKIYIYRFYTKTT